MVFSIMKRGYRFECARLIRARLIASFPRPTRCIATGIAGASLLSLAIPGEANAEGRGPKPLKTVEIGDKKFKVISVRSKNSTYVTIVDIFGAGSFDPCVPFCNACVADDGHICISGTIGITPGTPKLVEGGVGAETTGVGYAFVWTATIFRQ